MKRLAWYVLLTLTVCFAQIPIPVGFPTGNTTGPIGAGLSYSDLKASGGMTISTAGAVIQGLDISGGITVKANNVTIKNCRINSSGYYCIKMDGGRNAVIEYCELKGAIAAAMNGGEYHIRYSNVYGAHDGIKAPNNGSIEYCWIHDQLKEAGTHNDGIQNSGGASHIVIRGNTIQGPYRTSTSAIIFSTNMGKIDDVLIEGNFLSGGSYTVYMTDKGTGNGPPTNIIFKDNVWEWDSWARKPDGVTIRPTAYITYDGNPTFICNRFHTGELIVQNPGCAVVITPPEHGLPAEKQPGRTMLFNILGRKAGLTPGPGFYLITGKKPRNAHKLVYVK